MRAEALVDAGALLALLDRDDAWHSACVEAFESVRLPLLTTHAALTELFHLVGDRRSDVAAAWRLVRSGAITVADVAEAELPELDALMAKYHDRPMDFADATLVLLAKRERLSTILTVDVADFETYRIEGKKKFRVLPGRRR